MFSVLPFRPIKGQAFKVYFDTVNITNYSTFLSSAPTNVLIKVSKDNGAYATASNSITNVGTPSADASAHYVQLTATEMDADVVIVSVTNYNASAGSDMEVHTIVIYTTGFSGFGKSKIDQAEVISGKDYVPLAEPTVGDLMKSLYWYVRKNKNKR